MIELQERVSVPVSAITVWPLIKSPLLVASCITGATLEATEVPDLYAGTMRVKFGPTVVSFLGEAHITYDDAARTCKVEGRGRDKRGASNATASITIALTGAAGTDGSELSVDGGFALTGPLEGFARSGGVHIARVMLQDFATNLSQIAQSTEPAPARTSGEVLDAASVTGQVSKAWFARVFKATKDWITKVFRGRTL